jgi:flagellin-like protein
MEKKGDMGIGTLIIFIAMILVAAIAAGVLIQTAGTLQNKALQTGDRSKVQVSTSITVTQIFAENGSSGGLTDFFITLKLAPGSDPIKFTDALVSFSLKDKSVNLAYKNAGCISDSGTGYRSNQATGEGNYTVQYLINGSNHMDSYLTIGDVARICLESPRQVTEDESIKINILPKTGSQANLDFSSPNVISQRRMFLFP